MDLEPAPSFDALVTDPERLGDFASVARHPDFHLLTASYRPWRKVRRIARDMGIDPKTAWLHLKWGRLFSKRSLPLRTSGKENFSYCLAAAILEPLHRIDLAVGGGGIASIDSETGALADRDQQRRFRIRTLMDEAIESSRIEGAVSTRKNAVDLLRSGRSPKTRHEWMFANNYDAMRLVKSRLNEPLTPALLLDLQRAVTRNTIDVKDAGRLRQPGEDVRVFDERDGTPIFTPPDAAGLEQRLEAICTFANKQHVGPEFIHPIVKASILHFMIGYEHPFVDGNGRTARAVFYWSALRQGYRIFEYLTISDIIREGSSRYPQAYLDSELDAGDLTYFVLYKLNVIEQSLERCSKHLQREEEKIKASERFVALSRDLNLRQRLLLGHALRHPSTVYSVRSHANSNGVEEVTARADLKGLVTRKLLVAFKDRQQVLYQLAPGVPARLAKKGL